MEAKIKAHKSYGSVWKAGDLVAGWEPPRWPSEHGEFSVLICVKPREVGPRGGVRAPAESATITARSWAAVCRAIQSLGFTRPTLTATEVRRGR